MQGTHTDARCLGSTLVGGWDPTHAYKISLQDVGGLVVILTDPSFSSVPCKYNTTSLALIQYQTLQS